MTIFHELCGSSFCKEIGKKFAGKQRMRFGGGYLKQAEKELKELLG
jgi:hypothetical protein